MSTAPLSGDQRRHDLDALRAVAMLLGIALHAAIAFIPGKGGWMIKDTQTNDLFALFVASIHGFRMPLFFLISGFFTMMLFRRRGLKSLLGHRFKRIFVPLVLAMFTITPAMWAVTAYVNATPSPASSNEPAAKPDTDNIQVMAALGDVDGLVKRLDAGSQVDASDDSGTTPLMMATMFGQIDAAKLLIDRGADASMRNQYGSSAADMLTLDEETTKWVAGLIEIPHDAKAIARGRTAIAKKLPTFADVQTDTSSTGRPRNSGVISALTNVPLFGHLWFLWFLCWLVAGFALIAIIVRFVGLPTPPAWVVNSNFAYAWLIPLTMIPAAFMRGDGMNFGPDTSIGLLPIPAVLAYYAIFFGFGAMFYDAGDDRRLGRWWKITLPIGLLVLFPIGIATGSQTDGLGRVVSLITQSTYVWWMSFGLMGLFRHWFSAESRWMRYLSDSSYWLYLAHLPLVVLVQSWVVDYQVSPFLKFPLICLVTSSILLVSYQFLIRYSPIGVLLNGKRTRQSRRRSASREIGFDSQ